jgi:V8-like Glu-specific endopeptidase
VRRQSSVHSMRLAFGLVTAMMAATPGALGQTAAFNPADYGKAHWPMRQSVGDAADFIASNRGAFEPVSELDSRDALALLARPIGRIDVVMRDSRTGQEVGTSCTGALLPGNHVLTNHHCLPVSGPLVPLRASILMDYLTQDGRGAKRFDLEVKPLEADAGLDYAVAKVSGDPVREFGAARIQVADVQPSQSLVIIHHPLGRPKVISRFRCLATREQADGPDLRHRCDTLGGSSGSLIYDASARGVALHKEGGLDPKDPASFNSATRMAAIMAKSRILQAAAQSDTAPPAQREPAQVQPSQVQPTQGASPSAPAHSLTPGQMNDLLKK